MTGLVQLKRVWGIQPKSMMMNFGRNRRMHDGGLVRRSLGLRAQARTAQRAIPTFEGALGRFWIIAARGVGVFGGGGGPGGHSAKPVWDRGQRVGQRRHGDVEGRFHGAAGVRALFRNACISATRTGRI